MSRSDFIGDFLTAIRNAARAKKDKLTVPASSLTVRIAEILKEEGFVENVKPFSEGQKSFVRVHLKYLPGGKKSGLVEAQTVLDGISGIQFVRLNETDVVRHALVMEIIKAYEKHEH